MIMVEKIVILGSAFRKKAESGCRELHVNGFSFVTLNDHKATFSFVATVEFGPDLPIPRVAPVEIQDKEALPVEEYLSLLSSIQDFLGGSYAKFSALIAEHYSHLEV